MIPLDSPPGWYSVYEYGRTDAPTLRYGTIGPDGYFRPVAIPDPQPTPPPQPPAPKPQAPIAGEVNGNYGIDLAGLASSPVNSFETNDPAFAPGGSETDLIGREMPLPLGVPRPKGRTGYLLGTLAALVVFLGGYEIMRSRRK